MDRETFGYFCMFAALIFSTSCIGGALVALAATLFR